MNNNELRNMDDIIEFFVQIQTDDKIEIITEMNTDEKVEGNGPNYDTYYGAVRQSKIKVNDEVFLLSVPEYGRANIDEATYNKEYVEFYNLIKGIETPISELDEKQYFEYSEGIKRVVEKQNDIIGKRAEVSLNIETRRIQEEKQKSREQIIANILEVVEKVIKIPETLMKKYENYTNNKNLTQTIIERKNNQVETEKNRKQFNSRFTK